MILKLRRVQQIQLLIWILLLGPFFVNALMQFLHFPSLTKYLLDAVWLVLLALVILKRKQRTKYEVAFLMMWASLFLVYTLIAYVSNYQSALYYLWGFRNNFRFFALFFAIIYFLDKKDVSSYFRFLDAFFYINAVIMVFQYAVLHLGQDYIGGIFGIQQGCNAYTNIYFCIVTIITYIRYANKEETIKILLTKFGLILVLAAIAELKFFFIEFVFIIALASLVTKFTWKKLLIIVAFAMLFVVAVQILINIYPYFSTFFSLSGIYEYASSSSGYTGSGDLNRIGFVRRVNDSFLTSPAKQIFGLGLGNCDYADGYSFLTSPFFLRNKSIHYTWLSSAFMYLETGWIGMIFFFGFFIVNGFFFYRRLRNNSSDKSLYQIGFITSILIVLNLIYNSGMRTEAGYMFYSVLALPWVRNSGKV